MQRAIWIFLIMGMMAQDFRATLTGRIADSTGAAIAEAQVVLHNVDTDESARAKTGRDGLYTFALVKPGNYELRAEKAGFKSTVRSGITLQVNQAAELPLTLALGVVTETVTVTDEAPLLDTASGDRGAVLDEQFIKEMPLNGRNPFMLSMLAPGVNYNGSQVYQRPFDNGAIASWGINGGTNGANEFLMDGVPNNAQAGGNNIAYVPPVDSVQEFKIQTNAYDAQYGKTSGGIVNVVLKSGTNRLHGTVYEFARRNAWDANSFQNNARGEPKDGHYLDQYGVQLDGPVVIPKLYNGRGKTFFLTNFEGYREATPQPLVLSVPAPEMRNGDFSKLLDGRGRQIQIYDPATGFQNTAINRWDRLPFPGNIIPPDRINPISRNVLKYFPAPNTRTDSTNYSQSNFFISGSDTAARDTFYNFVFKVDQNLGEHHRFFFRHASNDRTEDRTFNGIKDSPGQDGQHPLKRVNDAYVIDWVSTLSPTLIFNIRSSFARYVEGSAGNANAGFDLSSLGFPKKLVEQMPYGAFFGRYTFTDYMSLGRYPSNNISNTFTVHPTITRARGNKTLKAGLDMRWSQYSQQSYGNVFTLGGTKVFTQRDYLRADELSGNSIASWLLGTPSSGSINYNVFPIYLFPYYAPWVQHDWKVTRKLTINSGLRWDFNVPPRERFNRMNRGFDETTLSPLDKQIDHARFPYIPTINGGLLFAGVNGTPRRAADLFKYALQPRIGFAYALNGSTVLRGGWGRFFVNPNNDYLQTTGFSQTTPLVFSANESRTPVNNKINDPFPSGILTPYGSNLGPLTYAGRTFPFVNPNFKLPSVESFSFGIQRLILKKVRLELTYSGSRGRNLQNSKSFNDYDANLRDNCNFMLGGNPAPCDQGLANPFRNVPAFEGTSWYDSATLSRAQLVRPFPQFGGLTELMRNDGTNWYNSLQAVGSARLKWTNVMGNYTFAKNVEENGFNDPLRGVLQRGLAAYDRPHRFVISAVTQLPFFKNAKGWKGRLLKGWENSVIWQTQSGRPWGLPGNVLYLKEASIPIDWSQARIQALKPCVMRWNENNTITWQRFSQEYGCTEANFIVTPRYSARTTPLRDGRLRLQGTRLMDMSINKTTAINERYRVQFRAEAFNVFNSFFISNASFNNNPEDVNFGSIIKASVSAPNSNYPRQIQFALKLIW